MDKWTDYNDIKNILIKKWDRGYILKSVFLEDDFFPFSINLKYPSSKDFEFLPEIIDWHEKLKLHKDLELKYKTFSSKIHGKNSLPTHAIIKDVNTAIKIIKKEKELKKFINNSQILMSEFPTLKDWIAKKPIKISGIKDVEDVVKVIRWFANDNDTDIYIREICIEGIHSKFIERNKVIISEILDLILPSEKINSNSSKFEERYKLKKELESVRFRILDNEFSIDGLKDIRVPITDFENLDLKVDNIFFAENLTNFLSFPNKKSSIIVFSKGYFVDILKIAEWFNSKNLYYWGDIDTHGFNILSMARSHFQNIKSILMTEEVLLEHKKMWVSEEKQFIGEVHNLTSEELELYTKLRNNFYGEKVRLEQEFIKFSLIEELDL